MKAILVEAALVAGTGLVLAFVANALSPAGLKLTQDFFPGPKSDSVQASSTSQRQNAVSMEETNLQNRVLASELRQQGLQLIDGGQAASLFHDPARELGQIVFIDARDEEHFKAAHIPGAYPFDHYHAEKYFGTVLPACLQARQVVVYCKGGDCEDSTFAAIILRDAGVPKEKLLVYGGGITEWQAKGLPLEAGDRDSGLPAR